MADILRTRRAGPGACGREPGLGKAWVRLVGGVLLLLLLGAPRTTPSVAQTDGGIKDQIRSAEMSFLDGDCPRALGLLDRVLAAPELAPEDQTAALELKTKCLVSSNAGDAALRDFFCIVVKRRFAWRPNELDFSEEVLRLFRQSEQDCAMPSEATSRPPRTEPGGDPEAVLREVQALYAAGRCADAAGVIRGALGGRPEWPGDRWMQAKELQARSLVCAGQLVEARSAYRELLARKPSWRPNEATATPTERSCFQTALKEARPPRPKTWLYVVAGGAAAGIILAVLLGGDKPSNNGTIAISVPPQ